MPQLPSRTRASTLVLALIAFAPAMSAQSSSTTAEGEVRDTITRLVAAYGANDLDTYFAFFADDMTVWWGTNGRNDRPTPKAEYVRSWPEYVQKTGGHERCHAEDVRIQVAPGNAAAVSSYELTCTFRPAASGERRSSTYEITAVVFHREGTWKVVHFNWRERQERK